MREVAIAWCAGVVVMVGAVFTGWCLSGDEALVLIVAVVAGVLTWLGTAAYLDETINRPRGDRRGRR